MKKKNGGNRSKPDTSHSVRTLLQEIKEGRRPASALSIQDRQRCVERLMAEGSSAHQIADFLELDERMVYRDRAQIRQRNALEVGPNFVAEMAGEIRGFAMQTIERLQRLARATDTPAQVRLGAEQSGWVVMTGLMTKLQSLGYLPNAEQEIRARLVHSAEPPERWEDIERENKRLCKQIQSISVVPGSATPPTRAKHKHAVRE